MQSTWIDLLNLKKAVKANEFHVNFNTELFNAKSLPKDIQDKLDQRWNELINEKKPGRVLFNQSKFRLHSVDMNANDQNQTAQATLNLGLTDYKGFICTQQQNISNDIRQVIQEDNLAHPLGVGSLLITADDMIVLIKRSSACLDLPNLYDIPGGHAEPE